MTLLEFIPQKKFYILINIFFFGLIFSFSFDPYIVPLLSLIFIGLYFLLNDYAFEKFKDHYKIFFFNGILFGFGFFLLSMYWVSNSILEYDSELFYVAPLIAIFFPLFISIFFGVMQIVNAFYWSRSNSKYFTLVWFGHCLNF